MPESPPALPPTPIAVTLSFPACPDPACAGGLLPHLEPATAGVKSVGGAMLYEQWVPNTVILTWRCSICRKEY